MLNAILEYFFGISADDIQSRRLDKPEIRDSEISSRQGLDVTVSILLRSVVAAGSHDVIKTLGFAKPLRYALFATIRSLTSK